MYAYLGDRPFSADSWFEAVKRGRTFVTNGPMIEFHVDDALPGDEIKVADRNRTLRVKARAWGNSERNVPVKLKIVKHGATLREIAASDPSAQELSLDFTVIAEDGFWIAATTEANDGSVAHTTPVYVTRSKLRFWKYDEVDALLDKRLQSLADIEKMIAVAMQEKSKGSNGRGEPFKQFSAEERASYARVAADDPELYKDLKVELTDSLVLLGQQGPELLKRVKAAERIYEDLRAVAKREKKLRARNDKGRIAE